MNKKVMIVEDCFVQSTVIKKMLESENFGITNVCRSGDEALKSVEKSVPDVILMDIYIEGEIDGIETVKQIREKFKIPVLFLTALNNNEITERIKGIQFSGLLTKPINKPELITSIQNILKSTSPD
jgi:CheY-like chemotaxis protein